MYRPFYNLTRNPFELSPDPYFFYPTSRHNEALALLNYGVLRSKGFVVVTGEVGTGKTLLVRCLLDSLVQNKIAFAYIYNPVLSVRSFLEHVLMDLGLPAEARSKREALSRLNNFLLARSRNDLITALIIDEAQLLSLELLEEIRLLTNLETTQHKLLQIVLAGQPELDSKLDSQKLRQLKQRVALRCNLLPLDFNDVDGYIRRRLELAGASGREVFTIPAIEAIYRSSKGIPRLVNTLCENCLMLGFGLQVDRITPDIVREVVADLRLEQPVSADTREHTEVGGAQGQSGFITPDSVLAADDVPLLSEYLKRQNLLRTSKTDLEGSENSPNLGRAGKRPARSATEGENSGAAVSGETAQNLFLPKVESN